MMGNKPLVVCIKVGLVDWRRAREPTSFLYNRRGRFLTQ